MNCASSVSIIVPTFNRARYIEECLDSLVAQTTPPLEVIVVDDGSEDDTTTRVAKYGNLVRYVRKDNGGKPSAVNLGLSIARGAWIWIFDDDDVALPDAIQRRLEALASKPGAGFVYAPHFVGHDGPDGRIVRGRLNAPPQFADEAFFVEIMKGCFFHLATALVRRDHFTRLGGLDPELHRGQDYDFQIRLAHDAIPVYCSAPIFIFRQHAGVRGPEVARHCVDQRSEVFRRYSLAVGRKLRASFQLADFVVPRRVPPLDELQARKALLNRIHVMANHGCIDEFFEDLQRLLASLAPGARLAPAERVAIAAAMRAGWAYEVARSDWPRFLSQSRALTALNSGRVAVFALATGVFGLAKSYLTSPTARIEGIRRAGRLAIEACR